ncbi:MAG: adenylosuccinate lyase [Chlamydiales bacterium]|nr:adenylosuccinate lyase [Chlamydiales bacterium]
MSRDMYQSPWSSRYASPEMLKIFSDQNKYGLWRRLWVILAEAQHELGLPVNTRQISQLRAHVDDIDFDAVRQHEERVKHDVMAHVHAYGDQCPLARRIIHLGATSCYVTDNADVIQQRQALTLIQGKLVQIILALSKLAETYAATPCLAYTHFQPAQETTVGKRICLWLQDVLVDAQDLSYRIANLRLLGSKGAVGTQASFSILFDGDCSKVKALDAAIASKLGFEGIYTITGQTYPRKQDALIAHTIAGIGVSAHKFGTDLRLLASRGEFLEAFGDKQVGSSAMPYKRNPVLSERLCGFARYLITMAQNCDLTAALQWLERSLDDSANRRLVIPELFLCADAICNTWLHIILGLKINLPAIDELIKKHAPMLITETLLMHGVRKGGDRQQLHERLRQYSVESGPEFAKSIAADDAFGLDQQQVTDLISNVAEIGCAELQVHEFLKREVEPFLSHFPNITIQPPSVHV